MIANCDQIVDFDCSNFIHDAMERGLDGSILCFRDRYRDPKWSFARLGVSGLVEEVKEKVAISDLAHCRDLLFRPRGDFIDAAMDMIVANDRSNSEFFVCPVYNYMCRRGSRVGVYEIEFNAMHGIGTPDDLNSYLGLLKSA